MTSRKRDSGFGVDTGAAARCVRLLLHRRGVPKGQEAYVVAKILGLQYQQGHRKVAGKVPWTLDQLMAVGAHFGESLEQVLEPTLRAEWEEAFLVVGSWRAKCSVLLGPLVEPPFKCDLVAIGDKGRWVVVPSKDVNMPAQEVCGLWLCDQDSRTAQEPPSPAEPRH